MGSVIWDCVPGRWPRDYARVAREDACLGLKVTDMFLPVLLGKVTSFFFFPDYKRKDTVENLENIRNLQELNF